MMKRKSIKKYFIEGMLIIFSVLLALLLNKAFENYKTNQQAHVARASILRELKRNTEIAKDLLVHHRKIWDRIKAIRTGKNDSILLALKQQDHLNIGLLTGGESLVNELLLSTAWETARSTGIIAEFPYEEVEMLTKVYALQDIVVNKTLDNIVAQLFAPETHDLGNLERTLLQFELRFGELTGQEYLLNEFYEDVLAMLQKS